MASVYLTDTKYPEHISSVLLTIWKQTAVVALMYLHELLKGPMQNLHDHIGDVCVIITM